MSATPPAIEVEGLRKSFRIAKARGEGRRIPLIHPKYQQVQVFDGIDFEVAAGEFFGIVGRNGCGKSTLLKLLAGIYRPDSGRVEVRGHCAPVLDLGVGFDGELAARDNAIINGVMLGLSPKEARARTDQIIDFAELHDHSDAQLKHLSSGMKVRLAFATMLASDPDVLLIDEVLTVGDRQFREKSGDAMVGAARARQDDRARDALDGRHRAALQQGDAARGRQGRPRRRPRRGGGRVPGGEPRGRGGPPRPGSRGPAGGDRARRPAGRRRRSARLGRSGGGARDLGGAEGPEGAARPESELRGPHPLRADAARDPFDSHPRGRRPRAQAGRRPGAHARGREPPPARAVRGQLAVTRAVRKVDNLAASRKFEFPFVVSGDPVAGSRIALKHDLRVAASAPATLAQQLDRALESARPRAGV